MTQRHFRTEHLLSDLKARSVRGGITTASAQMIKLLLQTAGTMVLARILVPADFGLIAMVSVFTGFITLFKDLGLSMATVQRAEITHAQVSLLFWINVGLSIFLAGLAAASGPLLAWFYQEPKLVLIAIALAAIFIFGGLSAQHTALLRRQMRFRALAVIEICSMLIGIGTGVTMALNDFHHWALVGQVASQAAASTILSCSLSGWRPSLPHRGVGAKSMLKFGANLTGFNVANYLSRNMDNLLIGWKWGAGPLGYYTKAYGLLMMPLQQIIAPISSVAIPALSRLQTEPIRYRKAFLSVLEKIGFVTMPLMAFLVGAAPEVVGLLLGSQWMGAVPIFAWLGLIGLLQPVSNACGWLYITQNRTREMMIWGLISSVLTVASFLIGLPWGPTGVAAAYALSGIGVRVPLTAWFAGRQGAVSTKDIFKAISLPFVTAASALGLILLLRITYQFRSYPAAVAGVLGILLLVHLLGYGTTRRGRAMAATSIRGTMDLLRSGRGSKQPSKLTLLEDKSI